MTPPDPDLPDWVTAQGLVRTTLKYAICDEDDRHQPLARFFCWNPRGLNFWLRDEIAEDETLIPLKARECLRGGAR